MTHPASFVISLTEGLPFGQPNLLDSLLPLTVWHCRFDPSLFLDQDYQAYGVPVPPSITGAVEKRRAEYLAGRLAAARVLSVLGVDDYPLLPDENRAPLWPAHIQGSLTHHDSLALCIGRVSPDREVSGLGIDIERQLTDAMAAEIWPGIVSEEERQFLYTLPLPFAVALTLVFSAKQSVFKALFPRVNRYFDFLDARLVRLGEQRLTLELTVELTPQLPVGMCFDGVYARSGQDVMTVVAVF